MPLYTFHCADCDEDQELNIPIDERDNTEPHYCGEPMFRKIDAPSVHTKTVI